MWRDFVALKGFSKGVNAFTTGNPFFSNLLEVSIERVLGL